MGRPTINLIGQKFGRLTVLSQSPRENKTDPAKWLCVCDCGNTKIVRGPNLLKGNTKSCGCIVKENAIKNWKTQAEKNKKPLGYSSAKRTYGIKKRTSIARGLSFELTFDEFKNIVTSDCDYCGDAPSHVSNFKKLNGNFTYHGIDRVDNSKGYTIQNSVPCCWPCNRAKGDMTREEFFLLIKKIKLKHLL